MHRQQRVRSSSRWSSLALPLSSAGASIGTVSVSPRTRTSTSIPMSMCSAAGMSTSTTASPVLLSQPLQGSQGSQGSQASQTSLSSLFLPSSVSWPTSSLSSCSWGVQQTSCSRLSSAAGTRETGIASTVSVNGIAWPRLVSVLAWSVTLLLVSSCIGLTDAGILNGHPLGKRSFIDIQCKGIYDKSIFARLDRICEDCYNLFREPQLHQLCRKNCFTSDYFKGCLDVLLLQDEVEKIQTWIKQLHGAEPGV